MSPPDRPGISVVVPMFDEAAVAPRLVEVLAGILERTGRSWELLCVDDGSADGTAAVLGRLAEAEPRLRPVLLARNFGKEAALAAGLDLARGDAVIVIDADLQHPPELIPTLIARWEEGYDVVNAVKRSRGEEGLVHRLGARLFYAAMGHAVGPDFRRQSDFKLLDRQVVEALADCEERSRFFRGLVAWIGFRVTEVEFDVAERAGGRSGWSFGRLLRYSLRNLVAFSSVPLLAIGALGFVTSLAGALLGVQTFWNWARGVAVSGFTTTILSVLILGGAILVCLGVIAFYLAVIYEELKRRPLYVVRRERPTPR